MRLILDAWLPELQENKFEHTKHGVLRHSGSRKWTLCSRFCLSDKNPPRLIGATCTSACSWIQWDPNRAQDHLPPPENQVFLTSTYPQPRVMRPWGVHCPMLLCFCHSYGSPLTDLFFHQILHMQAYMNLLEGKDEQDPCCSHCSE